MARLAVAHLRHIASLTRYRFTRFTRYRVKKETFEVILHHLNPHLTREDTAMHDCIPPQKVLAIELYRLNHGNSYVSIGPTFNVDKSTVVEAVQDVLNALFDASDQLIKFLTTPADPKQRHLYKLFVRTHVQSWLTLPVQSTGHTKIIAPRENAVESCRYRKSVCLQAWCRHIIDSSPLFFTSFARYDPLRGRTSDPFILCPAKLVCR